MNHDPDALSEEIAHLRRPHEDRRLEPHDLDLNPVEQFAAWMEDALRAEGPLPNAMALATAEESGRPSIRTVLLKAFDDDGFVFYTNYWSRKGRELEKNPSAALLFHWPVLERQVCIRGHVAKVSSTESDEYFASRPLGSRLGAWASRQSEVVESRDELDVAFHAAADRFGKDVPRPENWGGFRLVPDEFEFWEARPNRLHDRFRYRNSPHGWSIERLSP